MHYLCCPRLCFRKERDAQQLPLEGWLFYRIISGVVIFEFASFFCPCSPLHCVSFIRSGTQGYIQRVQTASGQSRKVEVLSHFAGSLELCTVPRNIQLVRHSVFCLLDWCSLSFLIQRCGLSVSPMASLFRRFYSVSVMGKRYRRMVHRYGRVLRRIGACVTRRRT